MYIMLVVHFIFHRPQKILLDGARSLDGICRKFAPTQILHKLTPSHVNLCVLIKPQHDILQIFSLILMSEMRMRVK